jgi:hypothetical protein
VLLNDSAWKESIELREPEETPDTYVFQSRTKKWKGQDRSGRLDRTTIIDIVRAAAKRAGVPDFDKVSPHWLRHCHASHALDNGATLPEIRDTLGHSSIAVTDVYQHIHPDAQPEEERLNPHVFMLALAMLVITFGDVQDAVYRYIARTSKSPDEVLVGSNVNFAGVRQNQWSFEHGRVVWYAEANGKPFVLTVDETLEPRQIVCRNTFRGRP